MCYTGCIVNYLKKLLSNYAAFLPDRFKKGPVLMNTLEQQKLYALIVSMEDKILSHPDLCPFFENDSYETNSTEQEIVETFKILKRYLISQNAWTFIHTKSL